MGIGRGMGRMVGVDGRVLGRMAGVGFGWTTGGLCPGGLFPGGVAIGGLTMGGLGGRSGLPGGFGQGR